MQPKETLTPRQMEILTLVRDYDRRHGYSPTMQEIGDHLHLTKVTAFEHVRALERKGYLTRGRKHSARSLRISNDVEMPEDRPTRLRLVGQIAAGVPIEAVEDNETLDLEELFDRPSETFVLRVSGESMIDEHIRDGDFVVCERRTNPRQGETVVALLPDGDATLKKFYHEGNRIRLQPANPDFEPILVDEVDIQGVVVGVIRTM
jgi:repressor LexA